MKSLVVKVGAAAAAASLSLFVFACSPQGATEESQQGGETAQEEQEAVTYSIGDTVSTDVMELTLDDSQLAIALNNSMQVGANAPAPLDTDYGLPKEYDPEEDSGNPSVAAKGHTLVSFVYTVKNLDRVGLSLEAGSEGFLSGTDRLGSVEYDGQDYEFTSETRDYELVVDEEGHWLMGSENGSILNLEPGKSKVCRGYIDIPVETSSLDDPYKLTIDLPNSDGTKTPFTFEIN